MSEKNERMMNIPFTCSVDSCGVSEDSEVIKNCRSVDVLFSYI